jgi:hypothetical protein
MVVAMIPVWVMQLPVNEIVLMIPVRNAFVAAVRAVLVSSAVQFRGAAFRVCAARVDAVIIDVIAVDVMHVAVVQVIGVTVVLDSGMSTVWPMLMGVSFVRRAGCHASVSH